MCNFHWKIQKFKNPFFIMQYHFQSISSKIFFSYFTPFLQFHTFFHTFFNFFFVTARLLNCTNQLKKKVSLYLLRFSNFAWVQDLWHHTHAHTHAQTNFWITIPRVGLKALELKTSVYRVQILFWCSPLPPTINKS